jgi:hypothetical protein
MSDPVVRHPIYTFMLCMLFGTSFMITPLPILLLSTMLFMAGTEIRVGIGEALLAARFGDAFKAQLGTHHRLRPVGPGVGLSRRSVVKWKPLGQCLHLLKKVAELLFLGLGKFLNHFLFFETHGDILSHKSCAGSGDNPRYARPHKFVDPHMTHIVRRGYHCRKSIIFVDPID